jgi:thiol:disulfide interchange protein
MAGAAAAALLVGGCAPAKKAEPTAIAWNTSMESGLAAAGKTGRPILLDFYTDW